MMLYNQSHKPKIGISTNRDNGFTLLADAYVQSVFRAGGSPVLIPNINCRDTLAEILRDLDGLILSGGNDINPIILGEEPHRNIGKTDPTRDENELMLIDIARSFQLPMLGICYGHQMINVAFGGKIHQDINTLKETDVINHSQTSAREFAWHTAKLSTKESKLSTTVGNAETIEVNSFHHQAISTLAPEFIETAVASDGINESIEHPEYPIMGVQWHPEAMACKGNPTMLSLFEHLIKEAATYKQAKQLHNRIITIDSHTDTPMFFDAEINLNTKAGNQVNIPFMQEGMLDAAFMVAYLPQGKRDDDALKTATTYAINKINAIKKQEESLSHLMGIAYSEKDLRRLKAEGKKSIFLGIENAYALGKEINNVDLFREMGITYITLCHNGDNDVCDAATNGNNEWQGLSPFGKEVIKRMNNQGIMIDISHAAESTFYDTISNSTAPIIASHSSCRTLCNHPRNLNDEQIKTLAAHNGVIQICLYEGFITNGNQPATLSQAIEHIAHAINLVGINHVGIGSDFDGGGGIVGCRQANELINITTKLIQLGLSEKDIAKLWGGNLLRVMNNAQKLYKHQ